MFTIAEKRLSEGKLRFSSQIPINTQDVIVSSCIGEIPQKEYYKRLNIIRENNNLDKNVKYREKHELCNYLSRYKQNIFLTVTFKLSYPAANGLLKNIDLSDITRVSRVLKSKITRVFGGSKKQCNYIPFIEQNAEGRYHLHIAIDAIKPVDNIDDLKNRSIDMIKQKLYSICDTFEEIHRQKDFQIIDNRHVLLAYMSKTGASSFDWQSAKLVNTYPDMAKTTS